eukprot:TRINITY_DN7117_c0_g1_i2.p1 TRINITY_DN7117_c0_g1~~TRINITY_DN7117_c0_g1_i2.p1  ORF type:complete len:138 (+),score=37.44 TRINITY_DN7117_c0_g1_i2:71-484(+)
MKRAAAAATRAAKKARVASNTPPQRAPSGQQPVQFPEPKRWRELWDKVAEMRSAGDAPVDSEGCTSLADRTNPEDYRFQVLISLMLSSQTRDEATSSAMTKFKKAGCTVRSVAKMSEDKVRGLIKDVCFYNNKAKYI